MRGSHSKVAVRLVALMVALGVGLVGCGGGDKPADGGGANGSGGGAEGGTELSAFELEHGIGPITEVVEVGPLDAGLAAQGLEVFTIKCTACHKLEERYVGPAIGDVTERRSAAFIMNMILNPQEMYEQHPEGKALLAEYLTYMPNQNVTPEDARAIVEYLRSVAPPSAE